MQYIAINPVSNFFPGFKSLQCHPSFSTNNNIPEILTLNAVQEREGVWTGSGFGNYGTRLKHENNFVNTLNG